MEQQAVYTVFEIINAECNLEPIECLFCNSVEVEYHQYIGDAYCSHCGTWQLEEICPN